MQFENAIAPDADQISGFVQNDHGRAIYMVNLLKFREKAEYPKTHENHSKGLSGIEAYAIYGTKVNALLTQRGGGLEFAGAVERLVLGHVEELWDQVAIARYPNRQAMMAMIQSPEYGKIAVHRQAGLAGQLNIETTHLANGTVA